jgi:hypothetical protein
LASIDFILNPPGLKAVTARHGVWRLFPYGRRRDSTGVHPTRYRRVIGIVTTVERNHGCCTYAYSEQHREERGAQLASQTRRRRQTAELGVKIMVRMHSFSPGNRETQHPRNCSVKAARELAGR